jgi:hypothetical protein
MTIGAGLNGFLHIGATCCNESFGHDHMETLIVSTIIS